MENGTIEQGVTDAVDSLGSIDDEHPNDDGAEGIALDDGQLATEGEPQEGQFDPNSPEARHWQSVADKRVGKLEAMVKRLEGQVTSGKIREGGTASENTQVSVDDILDLDNFQPPRLPPGELADMGFDEASLSAIDKRFHEYGKALVVHTVRAISASNARLQAQHNQKTAASKIEAFVQENAEHGQKILALYDEMPDLAARNPDRFLKVVKAELGISDGAAQQPAPRRGLATAVSQSMTRPTRNGNAPARTAKPASLRDAVALAIDASMKRTGG